MMQNLKTERKRRNMTQADLVEELKNRGINTNVPNISAIESGYVEPDEELKKQLSAIFGETLYKNLLSDSDYAAEIPAWLSTAQRFQLFNKANQALLDSGIFKAQQDIAAVIGCAPSSYTVYLKGARSLPVRYFDELMKLTIKNIPSFITQFPKERVDVALVHKSEATVSDDEKIFIIPYKARAGYAQGLRDPEYLESFEYAYLPFIRNPKQHRIFEIEGESMMPEYNDGDMILCKQLPIENDITLFRNNRFIVILNDGSLIFKELEKYDRDSKVAYFKSLNGAYPHPVISMADVSELWYEKMHLKSI